MNGLGYIADVFGIKTYHRNPTIFQHVYVMSIDEMKGLRFTEPCIRKHAYLISDVVPATWGLLLLQFRSQALSHSNYPLSNGLQLFTPLLEVGLVVKDLVSNSCASEWW